MVLRSRGRQKRFASERQFSSLLQTLEHQSASTPISNHPCDLPLATVFRLGFSRQLCREEPEFLRVTGMSRRKFICRQRYYRVPRRGLQVHNSPLPRNPSQRLGQVNIGNDAWNPFLGSESRSANGLNKPIMITGRFRAPWTERDCVSVE